MKEYFVLVFDSFTDSGKATVCRSLLLNKQMALTFLAGLGGRLYRFESKRAANKARHQMSAKQLSELPLSLEIVDAINIHPNKINGVCDTIYQVTGTKCAKVMIGEHINLPNYIGNRHNGDGLGVTEGYIFT